MMKIVLRTLK